MTNGYVIAAWVATFASIAMYAYRTVIRSRQVAARLLEIDASAAPQRSPQPVDTAGTAAPEGGTP